MVTLKNISSNVIDVYYDVDNVALIEAFAAGATYNSQECISVSYSKGLAELIKNILQGNLEVRVDGDIIDSELAVEYIIEANKIETSKTSIVQKLIERDSFFEGLASGFIYAKNCKIG